MLTVSKSRVQLPGVETKKEKLTTQVANIKETIFAEEEEKKIKGAPDHSFLDAKTYKLYVVPLLPRDFDALCRTYIGAGASICLKTHCDKFHRGNGQHKKVHVVSVVSE